MFSFFGSPPLPLNLQLAPGSAPVEELVRGVRRGVWITRLWYVRMQDESRGVSTGLTRDGTFWIEGGELARPLRSARYTQALGELLGRVTAVASHGLLHAPTTWFEPRLRTGTWAPAIRVAGMRFTS
jgi:predicted Zn-dependent protease